MKEITFIVRPSPEGGYEAEAVSDSIFTQADDLETLESNIKEALQCHFDDGIQRVVKIERQDNNR
jgi:predicted RNase H-like HicB family nuclease